MKASNATMPKAEPVCFNGSMPDSASAVPGARKIAASNNEVRGQLTRRLCIHALDCLQKLLGNSRQLAIE